MTRTELRLLTIELLAAADLTTNDPRKLDRIINRFLDTLHDDPPDHTPLIPLEPFHANPSPPPTLKPGQLRISRKP